MGLLVLLLLVAWPITELYVASLVAAQIGWGLTLLLLLGLSLLGLVVLRGSGRAWRAVSAQAQPRPGSAVPPRGTGAAAANAGFQLLAGLLLLVPGFVTAAFGLLLMLPPVRVLVVALLGRWFSRRFPAWQTSVTRIRLLNPERDVVRGDVVDQSRPPRSRPPQSRPPQRPDDDQPPALH